MRMFLSKSHILLSVLLICVFMAVCETQKSQPDLLGDLSTEYDKCLIMQDSIFSLHWSINGINANFAVRAATNGWIGLGFTSSTTSVTMLSADAVIGSFHEDNNTATALDYYLSDKTPCVGVSGVCTDTARNGGVNNVYNVSGSYNNGVTELRFTRPVAASDNFDRKLDDVNTLLWSLGAPGQKEPTYAHLLKGYYKGSLYQQPICPGSPSPCSGNGVCVKGCCQCNTGYYGADCSTLSVNLTLPSFVDPAQFQHSVKLDNAFTLYWNVVNDTIIFGAVVKAVGWVGFGISRNGGMKNSDVFIGSVTGTSDSQKVTIADYWIEGEKLSKIFIDPHQDILAYNGGQKGGYTHFLVARKIDTNDTESDLPIYLTGCNYFIWAYHTKKVELSEHNHKGSIQIDFGQGVTCGNRLKVIHGILMFFAWGILVPFGALVARQLKEKQWWFQVHRATQICAVILAILGFILIVLSTVNHFDSFHAILGLIIFIVGLAQPIIGHLADYFYDSRRSYTPIWPDKIHWIIGYGLIVAALLNILLGLIKYGAVVGLSVVFGIYAVALIIVIVALWIWKFRQHKEHEALRDFSEMIEGEWS